MEAAIRELVRNIPDFPEPGIQFKDITPVLSHPESLKKIVEWFALTVEAAGPCDLVAGIESRGFIIGSALAIRLGTGFIPVRKPGKLPFSTHKIDYELEYGTDSLEIHTDAVEQGQRVVLVDDLLATGGTATAAAELIQKCGGQITCAAFLIELDFLNGRRHLESRAGKQIFSLLHY